MKKRRAELLPPGGVSLSSIFSRRRDASLIALAALAGLVAGIFAVFTSEMSPDASASYARAKDLRDAPLAGATGSRSELIARIAALGASERLAPPTTVETPGGSSHPKLIVIFDDMGLDRRAFTEIMTLPGPFTLAFLPYANNVQPLVDEARRRGDEILLHLPMEPSGSADPGPHSLEAAMRQDKLFDTLEWNLARFDGYAGVNNHMGSKFTRDEQSMKRVLSLLKQRGLFFVDSLTTSGSAASRAGAAVGAEVFVRDVFLDAEPGREAVRRQLALAEAIAVKTGYAVVICHPRRETLDVIGPWLTTAPARGIELSTITTLRQMSEKQLAAAP